MVKLLIVSGLSGSGKSIALQALEDQGLYCIDNLPMGLLLAFAQQLVSPNQKQYPHAAVGIDARNLVEDFQQFRERLDAVRALGITCEVIFLHADDNTLFKRFSETRRRHPLTSASVSLSEAIKAEREVLKPLAENADWSIDTTHTTLHQLRDLIRERVTGRDGASMSLLLMSFGYKHGLPQDADFVFDVRCLPNPHWIPSLRGLTGCDPQVSEFLRRHKAVQEMIENLRAFVSRWLPAFEADNRAYLTVAIGCTGGQHRSVFMVEELAQGLRAGPVNILTRHRELS